MEIGSYVPQFFYDLIGRAVPGAMVVACALFSFDKPKETFLRLVTWSDSASTDLLPLTVILVGGSLVSYVVGALLGGFWFPIRYRLAGTQSRGSTHFPNAAPEIHVFYREGKPEIDTGPLSYLYDYVQLRCPQAGSRMAKLRAENHMCGVVIVGSTILATANLIGLGISFSWRVFFLELFLVAAIVGAVCLVRHLEERSREVLANVWVLTQNRGLDKE